MGKDTKARGMSVNNSLQIEDIKTNLEKKYIYEGKRYVIRSPYRYYGIEIKGQMHCHTTNSDGHQSPTDLGVAYKNVGFGFIAFTDHDTITTDPQIQDLICIGGSVEEYASRHLPVYNTDAQVTLWPVQDIINYHKAKGAMVSIAHPIWSGYYSIGQEEIKSYTDFNFLEIYNAKTMSNSITADQIADWGLSCGKRFFLVAVDDCHDATTATEFNKGYVVANITDITKDAILSSLSTGNFYASTGNDIKVEVLDNVVSASSTSESNFQFIGKDGKVLQTNNNVTSASYTVVGNEMYVRVKSTKISDSTIAWSQPIFIDVLDNYDQYKINDISYLQYNEVGQINGNVIINGEPCVWQIGDTFTNPASATYTADMWQILSASDSGTFPNVTHSKIVYDRTGAGICDDTFSNRLYRISVDGAGSNLGTYSYYKIRIAVEQGVRNLCGANKDIAFGVIGRTTISGGKKIGVSLQQNYGTGGTPTTTEILNGTNFTLTGEWKLCPYVFKTSTLFGKTFGTNNNDLLYLDIYLVWGESISARSGDTVAETFVGSGDIELKLVSLNSGNKLVRNFRPFDEELIKCMRYFEKSYNYISPPATATSIGAYYYNTRRAAAAETAGSLITPESFKVKKYVIPTMKLYSPSGTVDAVRKSGTTDRTGATVSNPSERGFNTISLSNATGTPAIALDDLIDFQWTASSRI